MEIIKIGKDSFKISLNKNEMKKYELDTSSCGEVDENSYVKRLLNKAKNDAGVDFGNDKVSAEVYVSRDGGCEIFVSRVQTRSSDRTQKNRLVYKFTGIDSLLSACLRLKKISYDGYCEAYHNKESRSYYLFLEGINPKELKYAFLCEYGEKVRYNMIPYILEYCDCISTNKTVEIFSKLL